MSVFPDSLWRFWISKRSDRSVFVSMACWCTHNFSAVEVGDGRLENNICWQNSKMLAMPIMAKTQNLTVRLEKELIKKIEEEALQEKTDKSTVARKLITVGIEQTRKARALEEYRRGKCTIWKASMKAGIPLREMIELLRHEKIPLHISAEDVDEAWREAVGEK